MKCCLYIDTLLLQNGNTALHIACSIGRIEIIKYLLSKGADVSAENDVSHIFKFKNIS